MSKDLGSIILYIIIDVKNIIQYIKNIYYTMIVTNIKVRLTYLFIYVLTYLCIKYLMQQNETHALLTSIFFIVYM